MNHCKETSITQLSIKDTFAGQFSLRRDGAVFCVRSFSCSLPPSVSPLSSSSLSLFNPLKPRYSRASADSHRLEPWIMIQMLCLGFCQGSDSPPRDAAGCVYWTNEHHVITLVTVSWQQAHGKRIKSSLFFLFFFILIWACKSGKRTHFFFPDFFLSLFLKNVKVEKSA